MTAAPSKVEQREAQAATWAAYADAPTVANRNRIIEAHMSGIEAIAASIAARLPSHADREDLLSAAVMGAIAAIERFDPRRGIKFSTYMQTPIRGAILDYLRSIDPASRSTRERLGKIAKAESTFYAEHGRSPTDGELAQRLRIRAGLIREWRRVAYASTETRSFDADVADSPCNDRVIGCFADLRTEDPSRRAERNDIGLVVLKHWGLTRALLFAGYFVHGMTMRQCGESLGGICESRVSQLVSETIRGLKRLYGRERLHLMFGGPA